MGDLLGLEFEAPDGEKLRFEWDEDALAGLDAGSESAQPPWQLVGEVDWDEIEAIRVISARFDGGDTLAAASLRPAGAAGHGEEVAVVVLGSEEGVESVPDALISTEYDAEGKPRRLGLELEVEGQRLPLRVAADVAGVSERVDGGINHLRSVLHIRRSGGDGTGLYEILTPASS
jgi:hypothetical protein